MPRWRCTSRLPGGSSVRHARCHVFWEPQESCWNERPCKPTLRRREQTLGPSSFHTRANSKSLLKREGTFGSRRRTRPTIVDRDSDCEPLLTTGRVAVLSSDGAEDGPQAVSVCVPRIFPDRQWWEVAAAASPVCLYPPKRLRWTSRNVCRGRDASTVAVPSASLCDTLECDVTRADSEPDLPPPMCPPSILPTHMECEATRIQQVEVQAISRSGGG